MNELRWSGSAPVIAPKIAPVTFTDAALMGTALPGLSSGTPALKWQVTQPAGLYRAW
jgi:hypothetical protein